jgi:hypothetical protein
MHQPSPHREIHDQAITKEESTQSQSEMQQRKGPEAGRHQHHVFTNTTPTRLTRSSTSKSTLSKGLSFPDRRAAMNDSNSSLKANEYFPSSFSVPPSRNMSARRSLSSLQQRSSSETDVAGTSRSRSQRNLSLANYQRKATCLMAQRSNAHGVKELVSKLKQKCNTTITASEAEDLTQPSCDVHSPAISPFPECAMLSQISKDAYYRVVIGSVDGVAAIIEAMATFVSHANLQEACCTALGNLCERNGSNQLSIHKNEGIQQIVAVMRLHSTSIAVQSASCDALRSMSILLLAPPESAKTSPQLLSDVKEVLTNATNMYITPKSKERANQLLIALQLQDAAAKLAAVQITR